MLCSASELCELVAELARKMCAFTYSDKDACGGHGLYCEVGTGDDSSRGHRQAMNSLQSRIVGIKSYRRRAAIVSTCSLQVVWLRQELVVSRIP